MKKAYLATMLLVPILYIVFMNFYSSGIQETSISANNIYWDKERTLIKFIEENLIGINGEIFTNTKPSKEGLNTLSESVGLLMNYCVLSDRKDLFDKEYEFIMSKLMYDNQYIQWQTGDKMSNCNAAIDDLRIMRALLDAYNKWNEKRYLDAAGVIQMGVYNKQVEAGKIYEFYDWKSDLSKKVIPSCYLDLYTMDRLSVFNEGWGEVVDNSINIIKGGRINGKSPFHHKYFDYKTGKYSMDEEVRNNKGICLTYTIYTAIHMAEMNEDTEYFTNWLKTELNKGKVYAWYNPYTLAPAQDIESTAVYALGAVYAKKIGDTELYTRLTEKMLQFMNTNPNSSCFGGFGNSETGDYYSFDNLTALWALAIAK